MSDSSIKQSDISDFLKYLIELGGMYKVDESNYVLMRTIVNDEVIYKPEMVKNGETTAPLSCYHEKDTPIGSIIVNPFREGSVDTVDKKWFYTTKTIIVSGLLSSIIKTIIEDVLECKNKKKKEDIETSSLSHAELISKFVDIVDDKLVEEFKTISSNIKGFANIFYLTNKREAKFRVGVYDTSFRDQFKRNVRQKSWTIFENIVNTVLDTTPDMTEFICKPTDHMGAPKFEAYLKDTKNTMYAIGSVVGPHPFPKMVRDFQAVVGFEAKEQFIEITGELPDTVVASVGGGSNAMGIFSGFIDDAVELIAVEPLGKGSKLGEHAASLIYGSEGVMHGFRSIMLQDEKGEPAAVHSIASGLDYPSVGPEHAYLHSIKRTKIATIADEEAISAFFELSRKEGIIPAIESSHALAYALKIAPELKGKKILINLSGRGDKDIDFVVQNYGYGD